MILQTIKPWSSGIKNYSPKVITLRRSLNHPIFLRNRLGTTQSFTACKKELGRSLKRTNLKKALIFSKPNHAVIGKPI